MPSAAWIWPGVGGRSVPTCGLFRSEPDELRVGILPSAADLGQDFKFGAAGEETGWRFRPCKMAVPVPDVPLLKIFSFLDAFSLLQASRVNRVNAPHRPPSVGGPPPPPPPPQPPPFHGSSHRPPSPQPLRAGLSATPAWGPRSLPPRLRLPCSGPFLRLPQTQCPGFSCPS